MAYGPAASLNILRHCRAAAEFLTIIWSMKALPGWTSSSVTTKRKGHLPTATGSSRTLAAWSNSPEPEESENGSAHPSLMRAMMLPEAKAEHISCCPCTLHDSAERLCLGYGHNLSLVTVTTCCFLAAHGAFELQHPPFCAKPSFTRGAAATWV